MIPFDFFYNVMRDHFFDKSGIALLCPVFNQNRIYFVSKSTSYPIVLKPTVIFYDQEPIDVTKFYIELYRSYSQSFSACRVLVTSEYSTESDKLCNDYNLKDVQYFYHALLCHEWYRLHWYDNINVNTDFERTYITYNNLTLDKRLYRANLVIELQKRDLVGKGYVSYNTADVKSIEASTNSYQWLPEPHKTNIRSHMHLLEKQMIIDTSDPRGELSAAVNVADMQKAFVNLVTETIFYENKQHLTEKIFKPIVAKMPFLLLAGAGNLAYLRKYGFRTFGEFWDEGYDTITNSADRFDAVLAILEDLCNKTHEELVQMKLAMAEILEYNFNHFYTTMRPLVVNELTDKLGSALTECNIPYNPADLQNLNRILAY
jgi:hypothetical protein